MLTPANKLRGTALFADVPPLGRMDVMDGCAQATRKQTFFYQLSNFPFVSVWSSGVKGAMVSKQCARAVWWCQIQGLLTTYAATLPAEKEKKILFFRRCTRLPNGLDSR